MSEEMNLSELREGMDRERLRKLAEKRGAVDYRMGTKVDQNPYEEGSELFEIWKDSYLQEKEYWSTK